MDDQGLGDGNKIGADELKSDINRRLNDIEVKYLRDVCDRSAKPPKEYFLGLASTAGSPSDIDYIVSSYPDAAQRFIELHDLYFQPGEVAKSGVIDELAPDEFDRTVLNKQGIFDSFKRLLLIAMDAFYDPVSDSLSTDFDIMVGRAQIRRERTDGRYRFDTSLPFDDTDKIESRINQFLQHQNQEGETLAAWHGVTDSGFWVKLFKRRNRQSVYKFEESNAGPPNVPTVTTESRYPVKTFAAEVRETEDSIEIQTFDNLNQSGMKKLFRSLLRKVAKDPNAFESFTRVQSSKAKDLVNTFVEEAENAADEDEEDIEVSGSLQNQMDKISEEVESDLDDEDEEDEAVKQQLENDTPTFVGFNIENDEPTGIEQFRVRSEGPFADFGGQIEEFNEATRSLIREANKENIRLVFRITPPDDDRTSFFTVEYGDWSDFQGVSQDIYDTLQRLFEDPDE